jgi:hypothetical protein
VADDSKKRKHGGILPLKPVKMAKTGKDKQPSNGTPLQEEQKAGKLSKKQQKKAEKAQESAQEPKKSKQQQQQLAEEDGEDLNDDGEEMSEEQWASLGGAGSMGSDEDVDEDEDEQGNNRFAHADNDEEDEISGEEEDEAEGELDDDFVEEEEEEGSSGSDSLIMEDLEASDDSETEAAAAAEAFLDFSAFDKQSTSLKPSSQKQGKQPQHPTNGGAKPQKLSQPAAKQQGSTNKSSNKSAEKISAHKSQPQSNGAAEKSQKRRIEPILVQESVEITPEKSSKAKNPTKSSSPAQDSNISTPQHNSKKFLSAQPATVMKPSQNFLQQESASKTPRSVRFSLTHNQVQEFNFWEKAATKGSLAELLTKKSPRPAISASSLSNHKQRLAEQAAKSAKNAEMKRKLAFAFKSNKGNKQGNNNNNHSSSSSPSSISPKSNRPKAKDFF